MNNNCSAASSPAGIAASLVPASINRALSDADFAGSQSDISEDSPSVKAFNDFLELYVDPFVSLSEETNDLVGEQAASLGRAFQFQGRFIKVAGESARPDFTSARTAEVLAPLQNDIAAINDFKDANRRADVFANLNAIAEGAGVLSWFLIDTPLSYIQEIKDSATFWTNKVLKEFKEKDQRHIEWVKQFLGIFDGLKLYVKQFHTTGLTWKADGGDFISSFRKAIGSSTFESTPAPPAPSSGGGAPAPPPPPPPPPADLFADDSSSGGAPPATGINAVFSELNQGEGITKGLKKVDRSQMTHKNPELRQSSVVRSSSSSSTSSKKSPPIPKKPQNLSLKPKPEPVIKLEDSKWIVKNVEGKHDIILDGEISQSVFIADSKDSNIQIKGKINAVSISSTTKVALVLDAAISGVSVINSKKFGIQIVEQVPQISIDKSDEGQIYLSKKSLTTEIYTTSTTSLNVNVPDDEVDDFKEVSIPEQFKFSFNEKGQLQSEVVEHAG